jgi:hypothetical protein
MSEERRAGKREAKKVDTQGAARQKAQGKGGSEQGLAGGATNPGVSKRPGNGKPSDVKMGAYDGKMDAYDVKMGAYDVKMGFGGKADKKK